MCPQHKSQPTGAPSDIMNTILMHFMHDAHCKITANNSASPSAPSMCALLPSIVDGRRLSIQGTTASSPVHNNCVCYIPNLLPNRLKRYRGQAG